MPSLCGTRTIPMTIKHVLCIDFHNVVKVFLHKISESKFDLVESKWMVDMVGGVELVSLIYDVYADYFVRTFDRSMIPQCIVSYMAPQLPDDKWEIMSSFQSFEESIDKRALFSKWGEDVVRIASDNSVVDSIFEQFSNCLCWAIDEIIYFHQKENKMNLFS